VNFESGQVTVKPRTLLDWLAKWLLDYRDKLAICEREGCEHPYFVRTHARQRFCSHDCANTVRHEKKERWWAENRDRFLKKCRHERKSARRGRCQSWSAPRSGRLLGLRCSCALARVPAGLKLTESGREFTLLPLIGQFPSTP